MMPAIIPASSQPSRSTSRSSITCWTCGRRGHYQSECTQPTVQDQANTTQRAAPIRSRMCKSSNVYLNCTIKGRPVSFLLDTGSDYSLASYDCFKKHKCKLRKSDVKTIKAANGSDIIIEGETTIPLHVDGR